MTLRTRLLLGYALLVLLLVATGVAGAFEFRDISILVNRRLEHFATTTKAASAVLRAIEGEDRILLRAIVAEGRAEDDPRSCEEELAAAHAEFRRALAGIETRADADQARLVAEIRAAESAFTDARDAVLAARRSDESSAAVAYGRTFAPALEHIREPCDALFEESRQNMYEARSAVRESATNGSVLLGILVMVGLLSLVVLARSMRTHVLERLDELRRFSEAIAAGEMHQRAMLTGQDELARMASQMNTMLDRQVALEGRLEGRLAQDRRMLIGMLSAFRDDSLLLSTSGDLITWSGGMPDAEIVDALAVRAVERGRAIAAGEPAPTQALEWEGPGGTRWRVHCLRSGGNATGWLAEPIE